MLSMFEKVRYTTVWCPTNRFYPNVYDICRDGDIFYDDKFCSLFSFFSEKFKGQEETVRVHLTYLNRIVVTDADECPIFSDLFDDSFRMMRDFSYLQVN